MFKIQRHLTFKMTGPQPTNLEVLLHGNRDGEIGMDRLVNLDVNRQRITMDR
jgi:hypothetical protein